MVTQTKFLSYFGLLVLAAVLVFAWWIRRANTAESSTAEQTAVTENLDLPRPGMAVETSVEQSSAAPDRHPTPRKKSIKRDKKEPSPFEIVANEASITHEESSAPKEAEAALPRTLEEALVAYPGAEAAIRRYNRFITNGGDSPQMWARLDDWVRLEQEVNDCVTGKISRGFVNATLFFTPSPDSESELAVTRVRVYDFDLTMDQIADFRFCLELEALGRRQKILEEGYRNGFQANIRFRWPLQESSVFQFLATGSWPGYSFGPNY